MVRLPRAKKAALPLLLRTRLGHRALVARYEYAFTPEQLWAICEAATTVRTLNGAFAEIGVNAGRTTRYLIEHLRTLGPLPRYYALDTFHGFTEDDITVERLRGKIDDYGAWFDVSTRRLFNRMVAANGLGSTVEVIEGDAGAFDYRRLPPLAFALVDVDLLRPMQAALAGCWERLLPGGVIIADDCQNEVHTWDGAREAYMSFCEERRLTPDVRCRKLGFAYKR